MLNTGTLKVTTPTDTSVQMTRIFDAPKDLVFRAFFEPELLKRWFGPRGHQLTTCEVDYKVGGGFRYIIANPEGQEMGMRGKYLQLDPPNSSVHLESFDDYPGSEAEVTTVFTEENGKTTMVCTIEAPSKEVRDAVLASGMEHGAAESYDRLADMLAEGI